MINNQLTILRNVATKHSFNPDWLEWVVYLESNFNPTLKNPTSSATGLIQFIESTANQLGTTTAQIKKMSFEQQCILIDKYLTLNSKYVKRVKSFIDLYLVIFYPAAVGKPVDYIFPNQVFIYNPSFDTNKDKKITKQEFTLKIQKRLNQYVNVDITNIAPAGSITQAGYIFEDNFLVISIIIAFIFLAR